MTESINQQLPFSSSIFNESALNVDDIMVKSDTLIQPTKFKIHSSFVLALVTKGQGAIVINNRTYPLQKGAFLWLFPYHTYFIQSVSHAVEYVVFETTLNILMYSSVSNNATQNFISLFEHNDVPLVQSTKHQFEELSYLFNTSLTEYRERLAHFELILLGNLYKIIAIFSRVGHSSQSQEKKERHTTWFLYQYMHYHFTEDLRIQIVSEQLNISPKEINASLKKLTGKNFRDNLTAIRMMNARSMMRFSDLSIDYIAKFIGYQSTPSFNSQFKKIMGITPNVFRQRSKDSTQVEIHFKQSTAFDILQYLFDHYDEPVTSTKIATIFFTNATTINHLLYAEFGYSLSQLLTIVRMIFAKNLVVLTNKKIIQISMFTGYNSLRSFNRHFKQIWGVSPKTYREKYGYFQLIKKNHG